MDGPGQPTYPFQTLRSVDDVRQWRSSLENPTSIGFVPTMGALHDGHLQLIRHSLSSQQNTIVSIFLNPAQFGPAEDLSSYPSSIQSDLAQLAALSVQPDSLPTPHHSFDGKASSIAPSRTKADNLPPRRVSAVFLPTREVIYPSGINAQEEYQRGTFVTVHGLSEQLEGARRPGFFRGVATVVLKLFCIVEPNVAFFGQKDLQQCFVVRQLSKDLHLLRPSAIVIVPTVRDPESGLALSSRNTYLTDSEKAAARILFHFLSQCASQIISTGEVPSIEELSNRFCPPNPSISLDFISLNDPSNFAEIGPTVSTKTIAVAVSGAILVQCAGAAGRTVRLLDNIVVNYDLNCFI